MDTRAQEIRAEDINPRFNWGRALPALGIMGVDFEERVDYRRLHRYRLSRVKQKREAIFAEVGHTHLATVYWPGDKGPWHTTYDKKPLNGQVTRWQVWIGEDGARRRILG